MVFRGSTSGPTVGAYLTRSARTPSLVEHGALKIDGKRVNCGKRPTVLNPNFDSWGGAFPGFLILNTKKISGLSTQVKLYIYSHECGHQFEGADEIKADLFAIRRGVKWGWLDAQGMEDICAFISQLKGDSVHPPGPKRCDIMRKHYQARSRKSAARRRPLLRHDRAPRPWDPRSSALVEDPGDHQPEDHEEDQEAEMVKGSSPKMASPPETIAIIRTTTSDTPKLISAAFFEPEPSGERVARTGEPGQVIAAAPPRRQQQ